MKTVLLVEDQLEFRAIQTLYLQHHGYRVITAGDGESALRVARDARPDVILLDHSLPRRNGLDVARELRGSPDTAAIPIVLITAHAYGALGRRAREVGCAFLAKPCEPSRVLQEVRRLAN